MTTKTKLAAVALAALTVGTVFAGTADAKPWGHHWGGWGWGGVGLGIATGAYLASRPYYDDRVVYVDAPRCRWVRQFDDGGNYVGKAKVCRY